MNQILCSTGAIIGKPNNNDYRLLREYAPKLECDGFELMMSSAWYSHIDRVIDDIKSYKLSIPVVHSQKSLGSLITIPLKFPSILPGCHVHVPAESAIIIADIVETGLPCCCAD